MKTSCRCDSFQGCDINSHEKFTGTQGKRLSLCPGVSPRRVELLLGRGFEILPAAAHIIFIFHPQPYGFSATITNRCPKMISIQTEVVEEGAECHPRRHVGLKRPCYLSIS